MNRFIIGFLAILLLLFGSFTAKVKVYDNIEQYNDFIGVDAKEEYKNKWGMNEDIFPKNITDNMNVKDFKMVYYNPWDAQYLSYLVVNYDKEAYQQEVDRLQNYNSTDYIGYYGVTGFSKYSLLAMEADEYQGFVYAITDGESQIIYVEIIFCNYYMDINYTEYINSDFLPDGFDAKVDNDYKNKMLLN